MADIPQELTREARTLAATLSIHHSDTDRIEVIARALMARDQRAAKIAQTWTQEVHMGDGEFVTRPATGQQIATAILSKARSA